MDIRVVKKFAKYCINLALGLAALAAAVFLGQKLFDQPDIFINLGLLGFGIYTLYGVAKFKVDMERNAEQRLLDKIRDVK